MRRRLGIAATLVTMILAMAGPARAQSTVEEYRTLVAGLTDRVVGLGTGAISVNEAWDNRDVSFDDTVDAMQSLEAEARDVADQLAAAIPPAELETQHTALVEAANAVQAAATAMIAGLRASDTGEARRAALDEFTAATASFADLGALIQGPPETTTTTSTTTASTTTTSTTTAPTTSTAPPATAPPVTQAPADDGGSDVETPLLVLIGLLAGLLVGVTGGLLLGRGARLRLIDELRRQRGELPADEPPAF